MTTAPASQTRKTAPGNQPKGGSTLVGLQEDTVVIALLVVYIVINLILMGYYWRDGVAFAHFVEFSFPCLGAVLTGVGLYMRTDPNQKVRREKRLFAASFCCLFIALFAHAKANPGSHPEGSLFLAVTEAGVSLLAILALWSVGWSKTWLERIGKIALYLVLAAAGWYQLVRILQVYWRAGF